MAGYLPVGDQSGETGGRGGAREANSSAPCTILPSMIVSTDSMPFMASSGTLK